MAFDIFLRLIEVISRASGKRKVRRTVREWRRSGDDRRLRAMISEGEDTLEGVVGNLCDIARLGGTGGVFTSGDPSVTVGKSCGKYYVRIDNLAIPRETLLYSNLSLRDKFMGAMEELGNVGTSITAYESDISSASDDLYGSGPDRSHEDMLAAANALCDYMKIESICFGEKSRKTYKSQVLSPRFRRRRLPKKRKDEMRLTVKFSLSQYYPLLRSSVKERLDGFLGSFTSRYGIPATLKLR